VKDVDHVRELRNACKILHRMSDWKGTLKRPRGRWRLETVKKDIRLLEAKIKLWCSSDRHFICGGGRGEKASFLYEGSQAMPVRPDSDGMKVKTLG
jgi:phage host-nuclease inhibitor protein Gam